MLNTPKSGEPILPWANKATQEINSLRPTASDGIIITKTNNGTSFRLDKKAIVYPDSSPPVIAGKLSGDMVPENGFATTYSLEKNEQNALALFGFSKFDDLSNLHRYSLEELSNHVDFVLRDTTSANTILSCPTVRYDNVLCLLVNAVSENDLSGDNPIREALSCTPDSELKNDRLVSKSIYHNSEGGLALYHFENVGDDDIEKVSIDDTEDKKVLVRVYETPEGQTNAIPTLKYANLSNLYTPEGIKQFKTGLTKNDSDEITGLKVYIADLNSGVMLNSVILTQGGGPALVQGWNFFVGANALYLNIVYAQGAPGNLVSPTNIGNNVQGFVWNITTAQPANFVYSIKLCEIQNGELVVHHDGSVEVGAMIPDSADADAVGAGYRTKSLEFATPQPNLGPVQQQGEVSKGGLRLYGFAPQALNGGIGGNEVVAEWFNSLLNGTKDADSIALLYRDIDNGNGGTNVEQGTLKYLPLAALDQLIVTDTDVFRFGQGYSRSIQNIGRTVGDSTLGVGSRLYNFFWLQEFEPGSYRYAYPVEPPLSPSTSGYYDVVVRKRSDITSGVPEVSYMKLSTFFNGGGGGSQTSGLTLSVNVVVSSDYDTSTHQMKNYLSCLSFENGVLTKTGNGGTQTIFEAVKEMP